MIETGSVRKYLLYAAGEIILVMVGILLALQVNNWNENRKNRALEKEIMREINQEFRSNLLEFEANLKRYEVVRQNLQAIINSFPIDLQVVDLDTLGRQFEEILFRGNYDGTATSISKLKNTASLGIISNTELQSLLLQWEFMDADYRYDEEGALAFHRDQFAPTMFSKFSRPYAIGLRDERIDLKFLQSLEFEGLVKLRYSQVNNLFRTLNTEPNLLTVMKRIVELSESD
jgi:hypothetical protein